MAQAKQRPPSGKRKPTQPTQSAQPTPPKDQPTQPLRKQSVAERRAQRAAEAKAQQQRRQVRYLLIGLGVAAVVAVVAFFYLREQVAVQAIGTPVPTEKAEHVNEGTPLTYQYNPPASGKHYPSAQPAGIYDQQEINEGYWVHSLEHGYIVALVSCTDNCQAVFDQLRDIYDNDLKESAFGNVKFVATKYSKPFTNGHKPLLTLVAWGYEMELDSVDRQAIERFYNKFVDKGPENVP